MPYALMLACRLGLPLATGVPALAEPVAEPAEAAARIELVVLDIEGLDAAAFADALATRLPDRRQAPAGDPAAREGVAMWGYVQVRPHGSGWTLALILSDGRGYYREVERREGGDEPRLLANSLSNLVASVEEDALIADEQDVTIPDEVAPPEPEPESPEPGPPPSPAARQPTPPETPAEPTTPRLEVGPYLGGLALLSLGPPSPAGLAGGGGFAGVDFRLARGAVVGAELRGLGSSAADFGLLRLRMGVHAGYSWRRGAFELVSIAGLSAEPWFVRASGSAEPLRTESGPSRSGATALGGYLRVRPAYRRQLRQRLALRVGPFVGIAGSSVVAAGGGVARVFDQGGGSDAQLFRIGGLELSGGLELGLWWAAGLR